ncbi:MAG: phospholipid carrier-dependent glycosyltransferase [Actinomadura sp.]
MSTRTPADAASSSAAVTRPPVAPRGGDVARAGPGRRRWALLFGLGWLAQVAVRLWLGSGQTVPVATPDESGYLFAARVLTGGPDADMSFGTVYRGGYPLLLLPALLFGDDPVGVYRGALLINALVSAAMLPLAYLLLRRLGVRRRWSYVFAHVTAVLPCVLFYSEFALTDAILPVVLAGWLLLVHTWLNAPRITGGRAPGRLHAAGTGASLLAAYAYACHSRGAILLVVHAALLLAAPACRWRRWRDVLPAAFAAAAGTAAGTLLNRSLLPHMYPHGDNDLGGNVVRRLTTEDGWGWMLSLGTGQVWYQSVATGGVAAAGLVALAFAVVRPSAASAVRGTAGRTRALALAVLAVVAGIAFATSAALPVEYRIGNYVYGRYLACVTPVLFAVGVAVLLRAPQRALLGAAAAAAALTVAAACVVQWYAGDLLSLYTYTAYDFPETAFLTWDWTAFHLWHATLAGLVLLLAAVVFARPRRHGPPVLAAVLAVVAVGMSVTATDRIARPLVRDAIAHTDFRRSIDLREKRSIAVDWNVPWTIRLSHYYWAWWSEASVFDSRWTPPPQSADVIVLSWPENVPATASWPHGAPPGWHVVDSRRTPAGDWAAWSR